MFGRDAGAKKRVNEQRAELHRFGKMSDECNIYELTKESNKIGQKGISKGTATSFISTLKLFPSRPEGTDEQNNRKFSELIIVDEPDKEDETAKYKEPKKSKKVKKVPKTKAKEKK